MMPGRFSLYIIPVAIISVFFTSCLDTDQPDQPNQFVLSLTIPETGQSQIVGDDTLRVLNYKMVIDSLVILRPDDDEIFAPQPLYVNYSHASLDDESIIGSGPIRGGEFNGIQFTVLKPDYETTLQDQDLVTRDENGQITATYSFAVLGIINGEPFRFRSKASPAVQYGFQETVTMPENQGTMKVQLRGNWKEWFYIQQEDQLLNPNDPANQEQIEERITTYFDTEIFTIGEVL